MGIEILLVCLGTLAIVIGIIGAFVPIIPGPIVAWLSFIPLLFSGVLDKGALFWTAMIALAAIAILIQVLDMVVPAWGTKKMGGSKMGIIGAIIGLLVGVIFSPFSALLSIIFCPMIGAVSGEVLNTYLEQKKITEESLKSSVKAGLGAFAGFMAGTFMKFMTSLLIGSVFAFFAIKIITAVA